MKVVIIGGVAGGASAAARLRRLDEHAQIVMIERSGYVSYANCGLPYYIGGTITDRSKLTLQTPESFRARFDIDVRVRQEAITIDPEARTVTVRRLDDGSEYIEGYDKLILSPGARPVMPGLPGEDGERLFTLRTVEDTYRIADFVERERPGRVTVVGAGFIGLEMAENLRERGLEVTVVQRGDHVLPIFDADMAALLHNHLREHGVELLLNANVTGFAEHDGVVATSLADGRVIESDMVIAGRRPRLRGRRLCEGRAPACVHDLGAGSRGHVVPRGPRRMLRARRLVHPAHDHVRHRPRRRRGLRSARHRLPDVRRARPGQHPRRGLHLPPSDRALQRLHVGHAAGALHGT